jgi:methyltransferase (TIGR00027 family)
MTESDSVLNRLRNSASGAALVRAYAALEPDAEIKNPDYLASAFLDADMRPDPGGGDQFRQQLELVLPGAYHFQNARTWHIDTLMRRALSEGFEQVVILGAGYDSRAYRLGREFPAARFFEVDLPELQAEKRQKVLAEIGTVPAQVSYCPLDFNHQSLGQLIAMPTYDPARRTFFNWEGVSYYLTDAGVDATLDFVAQSSAAGSRVVFDYFPRSMIDGAVEYYGGAESRRYMAQFGEPVVFGIEDEDIAVFLRQRGLTLNTSIGPDQLEAMYLKRADGSTHGRVAGYARLAEAGIG